VNHETLPKPTGQRNNVEQMWHVICCDPDAGLCGYDLTGGLDGEPSCDRDLCVVCAELDELPTCSARFCRLRTWWRNRRRP
jgi:hypothetical protein